MSHFGDLLSRSTSATRRGDHEGSPFLPHEVFGRLSPLERILCTANGNLQRVVSSWSNGDVKVQVTKNDLVKESDECRIFSRQVHLLCNGVRFGVANSTVTLSKNKYIEAVDSGKVGLGQLFRQFDLLLSFELLGVEIHGADKLSRRYKLSSKGIMCDIEEIFELRTFKIPLSVVTQSRQLVEAGLNDQPTFGDVMSGTQTSVKVEGEDLLPFQRVLLTSNGNVERLLSSFLDAPIVVRIVDRGTLINEVRDESKTFTRHIEMTLPHGELLCVAQSRIVVKDPALLLDCSSPTFDIGGIFGNPGEEGSVLPRFELLKHGCEVEDSGLDANAEPKSKFGLHRKYKLYTMGVEVLVTESFTVRCWSEVGLQSEPVTSPRGSDPPIDDTLSC